MNEWETAIESLLEKAENYGKTSGELFKLNAIDKSSSVISTLATQSVIAIVVALFSLTLNIGVALWIGQLNGKSYFGFFVVAAFYALFAIILYVFRNKWIRNPINESIITQMLKK